MRQIRWTWPLILLFSAIAAEISAFTLPGTVLCLVVMLWFLLVCPGMMVVRYLNLQKPGEAWMLAIALSLAIDGLVAAIALYTGAWFPPGILGILITFCIVGVGAQFLLSCPASLARCDPFEKNIGNLASLFLLVCAALIAGRLGVWSYAMRAHTATSPGASSLAAPPVMQVGASSVGHLAPPAGRENLIESFQEKKTSSTHIYDADLIRGKLHGLTGDGD